MPGTYVHFKGARIYSSQDKYSFCYSRTFRNASVQRYAALRAGHLRSLRELPVPILPLFQRIAPDILISFPHSLFSRCQRFRLLASTLFIPVIKDLILNRSAQL